MKKQTLLSLIALIISALSFAQTFSAGNFLGEDYILYKGASFKIDPDNYYGFNRRFYGSLANARTVDFDGVLYGTLDEYDGLSDGITQKDSLRNKIFKVTNIIVDKDSYDPPIIVLQNVASKQIIYFRYNINNADDFPFLTTAIKPTFAFATSKIDRVPSDNSVTFYSPLLSPLSCSKTIEGGIGTVYLSLTINGTEQITGNGAVIEFTDGTKWKKPEEPISSKKDEYGEDEWISSTFTQLTPTEILMFTKKKIAKFSLSTSEKTIPDIEGEKFKLFMSAVNQMK